MKPLFTILPAVCLATSLTAATEETTKEQSESMREKARIAATERFNKLDIDKDGSLTLDEFKAGRLGKRDPAKAEQIFNRRDQNHDGKLTSDEFMWAGEKSGAYSDDDEH